MHIFGPPMDCKNTPRTLSPLQYSCVHFHYIWKMSKMSKSSAVIDKYSIYRFIFISTWDHNNHQIWFSHPSTYSPPLAPSFTFSLSLSIRKRAAFCFSVNKNMKRWPFVLILKPVSGTSSSFLCSLRQVAVATESVCFTVTAGIKYSLWFLQPKSSFSFQISSKGSQSLEKVDVAKNKKALKMTSL